MPRAGANDYQPGDAVPPLGDIVISATHMMHVGIVFVTRKQAKVAAEYGWRVIDGTSDDGKLVRVRRKYVDVRRTH